MAVRANSAGAGPLHATRGQRWRGPMIATLARWRAEIAAGTRSRSDCDALANAAQWAASAVELDAESFHELAQTRSERVAAILGAAGLLPPLEAATPETAAWPFSLATYRATHHARRLHR